MIKTRLYTEAEIFEAVCWAVGDDGNTATRTVKILNSNRKAYGKVDNNEYAKCRQDFNNVINEIQSQEDNNGKK